MMWLQEDKIRSHDKLTLLEVYVKSGIHIHKMDMFQNQKWQLMTS